MTSKGKQLKELIHAPGILITPGVYDGFSARLVQKMGFQTGTISGAGVSESKLGWADRGIMGYGENVEACRRIAACSDLLLQGDADTVASWA
jgi:2-methylisocitrate lyase-like PEP mutase family enzyme